MHLRIRDIVARWRGSTTEHIYPKGSTHDARIFNESSLKERFERGSFRGRLLGDSGYKLQTYLFTPILNPQSPSEKKYNEAHIATRNTVERCFGVWKQPFNVFHLDIFIYLQVRKYEDNNNCFSCASQHCY